MNSSSDENATVEVVFPNAAAAAEADAELTGGYAASDEPNSAAVPSSGFGNVTPNEKDFESIVASTLGEMPPELAAMAKDPKRHAKSKDPGWKYGFWPYEGKRDMVQCIFCRKVVPAGIKRFKQHIAGGYGDVEKCPTAPAIVRKEMYDFFKKNARKELNLQQGREWDCEADSEGEVQETCAVPSSGTRIKESNRMFARSYLDSAKQGSQKYMKSVSSMLQKSPEDVISERRSSRNSQPSTMEHCTKKSKEVKQRVDDHVADFFYENGIPLNAINSRSWEIMLEYIGQYGPGYRSPSYHDIRNPLVDRAVERVNETKKKHEEAWKEYGCSIMSDGWTDTSHHHLINFLANSPAGTFSLGSVDASNEVADAVMLADLLEKQIEKVGKEYVVQVVTDNGANFKAAGRILMERIPT
ncbi:uncharacterized protein LOC121776813 [Salvia splendens]|uniref:uncharacterized protein LOC121776813 n=1 Tax=Salvia splendens TaxID=180675 RepID=UPI001C25D1C7|nr:uncharacterized protein LOC121776813 [Salvia splendens]